MNSIGADQDVGFIDDLAPRMAIAEPGADLDVTLSERNEAQSVAETIAANAGTHGPQQQHLQRSAMHRNLRPPVSSSQPPGLAVDQLPVLVVETQALGCDSGLGQFVAQPQFG